MTLSVMTTALPSDICAVMGHRDSRPYILRTGRLRPTAMGLFLLVRCSLLGTSLQGSLLTCLTYTLLPPTPVPTPSLVEYDIFTFTGYEVLRCGRWTIWTLRVNVPLLNRVLKLTSRVVERSLRLKVTLSNV